MRKKTTLIVLTFLFLLTGCTTSQKDTVYQISTIDALLAGVYDGETTCGELLGHGNLGIGTFDKLDGEMIVMDGRMYQVKSDGRVYEPDDTLKTPFAAVCPFMPELTVTITDTLDYPALQHYLDTYIQNKNMFYAIKIRGTFLKMHTRSVPVQQKPYPPLAEVAKTQPEFEMEKVTGTVVGFRCPAFVEGINVPGYHLHFLSDDHDRGGHILGFVMNRGCAEMDRCNRFMLDLPENIEALHNLDLSVDRSASLEKVEK